MHTVGRPIEHNKELVKSAVFGCAYIFNEINVVSHFMKNWESAMGSPDIMTFWIVRIPILVIILGQNQGFSEFLLFFPIMVMSDFLSKQLLIFFSCDSISFYGNKNNQK